jgi:hypothetical protein
MIAQVEGNRSAMLCERSLHRAEISGDLNRPAAARAVSTLPFLDRVQHRCTGYAAH